MTVSRCEVIGMRVRTNVYFPPEILRQLIDLSDRKKMSRSSIVEAAVTPFLSPDGADRTEAAFAPRLDRLSGQGHRLVRGFSFWTQSHVFFFPFCLNISPPSPSHAAATPPENGPYTLLAL